MAALLEVEGLKAFYGQTQALHDVSFSLEPGGITTILGANGAGKTTTLRAICSMVVLPAPLAPRMVVMPPGSSEKLTSCRACV